MLKHDYSAVASTSPSQIKISKLLASIIKLSFPSHHLNNPVPVGGGMVPIGVVE